MFVQLAPPSSENFFVGNVRTLTMIMIIITPFLLLRFADSDSPTFDSRFDYACFSSSLYMCI